MVLLAVAAIDGSITAYSFGVGTLPTVAVNSATQCFAASRIRKCVHPVSGRPLAVGVHQPHTSLPQLVCLIVVHLQTCTGATLSGKPRACHIVGVGGEGVT
jgi:hypothetical protein